MLRGSGYDPDDVLQDVYLRADAALRGGVVPMDSVPGCCASSATPVLTNCAAPACGAAGDVELETLPAVSGQLPEVLVDRTEARALLGDIHRLPDRQKSVLVMSALDGLSHEEVAVRLDTTVDTTRSLLARARANLRQTARRVRPRASRCATRWKTPSPAACARARSPAVTCGRAGSAASTRPHCAPPVPSAPPGGLEPVGRGRPAARWRQCRHRPEGRGRCVLRARRRRQRGDRAGGQAPRAGRGAVAMLTPATSSRPRAGRRPKRATTRRPDRAVRDHPGRERPPPGRVGRQAGHEGPPRSSRPRPRRAVRSTRRSRTDYAGSTR